MNRLLGCFSLHQFFLISLHLILALLIRTAESLSYFTYFLEQMELDQLNRTQHELKHGSEQLEDILRKLEKEQVKIWNIFVSSQVYPKWVMEIEKSD